MNRNRERWLQLALVAVCAALEGVECTDEALTEALFVGMPGVKIDDLTAAAVAEALRRSGNLKEAAATLDRSRGFIHDTLKRRRRDWMTADWVAYGAELRRRRLLAGWSVSELSRRINLSAPTIRQIEQACGTLQPSELTLAKLAVALGMPCPPPFKSPARSRAMGRILIAAAIERLTWHGARVARRNAGAPSEAQAHHQRSPGGEMDNRPCAQSCPQESWAPIKIETTGV